MKRVKTINMLIAAVLTVLPGCSGYGGGKSENRSPLLVYQRTDMSEVPPYQAVSSGFYDSINEMLGYSDENPETAYSKELTEKALKEAELERKKPVMASAKPPEPALNQGLARGIIPAAVAPMSRAIPEKTLSEKIVPEKFKAPGQNMSTP